MEVKGVEVVKSMNVYEKTVDRLLDYDKVLPIFYDLNTRLLNTLD
jgi:hypothetical protein